MAIVNNESLVKFGYGVASQAVKTAGHITFASDTRQLFVGDGDKAVAFAGNVANAVFADEKLTITYNNGADAAVLDFSDVASAEGVSSLLIGLRDNVNANATAIANLSTTVTNLDTSYKAADASLSERLDTLEGLVGEGGDVDERIADAIEALDTSLKTYADGLDTSIRADFAAEDASIRAEFALADSSIRKDVSAYQTTNDAAVQANATAIGEVSTNLNTHTTNGDIHITAQERTDWNAAKTAIDTFLKDASLTGDVIDTLTEIQDYIASDASAADKLVKDLSDVSTRAEKGISDAAAAQSTANQALALGQAAATKSEFNTYVSTNNAALAEVKATADAAAVKTTTDTSLNLKADKTALEATDASITAIKNSYVISFGGAKGAISVDTTNASDGEVKFAMDGSTLKGSVNGWNKLGTAAFTDSTAYDASGAAASVKNEIIGDSVNDTSTSLTIQGVKKYVDEVAEQAQNAATVTGVDNTSKSDDEGYVTIALALDNKNVKVNSVTVETKSVDDASVDNNGLATALDVKNYVDSKELRWTVLP